MIKTARQLKDLIRNLSREKSVDAQILMRNYMMERFLERISLSEYRDKFILKGGMLVAAMVGLDARSTMDLDATIKGATTTCSVIFWRKTPKPTLNIRETTATGSTGRCRTRTAICPSLLPAGGTATIRSTSAIIRVENHD